MSIKVDLGNLELDYIAEFELLDREDRHALHKDTESYNRFCETLFEQISAQNSEWFQKKSDLTLSACAFMGPYLLEKAKKEGKEQIKKINQLKNKIRGSYNKHFNENLRESAFYLQNVLRPLTKRELSPLKAPDKGLLANISNYFSSWTTKNEIDGRVFLAGVWNIDGEFELEGKTHPYTPGFSSAYFSFLNHFFSTHYKNFLKLKTIQKHLPAKMIKEVTGCLDRLEVSLNSQVKNILDGKLTMIDVAWYGENSGHNVKVIFYKDLVIKANRGAGSEPSPGLLVYRRKNSYDSSTLETALKELQGKDIRNFFTKGLEKTLDLAPLFWIPQSYQLYDNCWKESFTSAVLACFYALFFKEYLQQNREEEAHRLAAAHAFMVHKKATPYLQLQAEAEYKSLSKNQDQALLKEIQKIKAEHPERF